MIQSPFASVTMPNFSHYHGPLVLWPCTKNEYEGSGNDAYEVCCDNFGHDYVLVAYVAIGPYHAWEYGSS